MTDKAKDIELSVSQSAGGYDYEFVDEPSEDMNCSVCLSILRDPHLTSCCGNHFCQSCITRIKDEGSPCPLCQEKAFMTMLNKSMSRKLRELAVRCPNKSLGCEWMGTIGDVELHLDRDNGCGYLAGNCSQCNESVTRINLAIHQKDYCPYRPYVCAYCGLNGTMKVITENHWPLCDMYPICCPNKCEIETLKRKDLVAHVKLDCPM